MATSPQDDLFIPGSLMRNALSEASSSASSTMLSSDTWQSISDELERNEQSMTPEGVIANAGDLPQRFISTTFGSILGHIGADPVFAGSHLFSTWEAPLPNSNPSTMPALLAEDSLPARQLPWTSPRTQLLGHEAVADSVPSSLSVYARDSMEMMFSSGEVVVTYDVWSSATPMTTNGSTQPSMPEVLSGLSLERRSSLDQGPSANPGQIMNTWICDINGCTKQFNQQHRYNKHIKSHSRPHTCRYRNCDFTSYQEKDVKRHINTVHRKAKIPCPVVECPYSRNGPRRGVSRKDALMRHLLNHGMTPDEIAIIQKMITPANQYYQDTVASAGQEPLETSDSYLDFLSFPPAEI